MPKNISDPSIRKAVYNKFDGHCAYCGHELNGRFQIDHFIPKLRCKHPEYRAWKQNREQGKDIIENYMPCCASCNACKSDLSIEEFRERILDRVYRLNKYYSEYTIIAKRFGLVIETDIPIIFHFEKFCDE